MDATFDAALNTTRIVVSRPKPGVDQKKPGLVLLRLATLNEKLVVEF